MYFKILLLIPFVHGYAFKTHSYLGELTERYLKSHEPGILYKLENDIQMSLANASIWADKVKNTKEYAWTRQLHYIDIMECNNITKEIDHKYCKNHCVTSSILDYTAQLAQSQLYTAEHELTRAEKIKFLIHYIQDFNQPMHLIGYERGGNGYKIIRNKNNRNKTTNLHSLWDSELPEFFIENFEYTGLTKNVSDVSTIDEYYTFLLEIMNKNYNIACNYIYGEWKNIHYIKFEDYFKQEHTRMLFDNYLEMIIKTLKFIYKSNSNINLLYLL